MARVVREGRDGERGHRDRRPVTAAAAHTPRVRDENTMRRSRTVIVAATNSTARSKAQADLVCASDPAAGATGYRDHATLAEAVALCRAPDDPHSYAGTVVLMEGDYYLWGNVAAPPGATTLRVTFEGQGPGTVLYGGGLIGPFFGVRALYSDGPRFHVQSVQDCTFEQNFILDQIVPDLPAVVGNSKHSLGTFTITANVHTAHLLNSRLLSTSDILASPSAFLRVADCELRGDLKMSVGTGARVSIGGSHLRDIHFDARHLSIANSRFRDLVQVAGASTWTDRHLSITGTDLRNVLGDALEWDNVVLGDNTVWAGVVNWNLTASRVHASDNQMVRMRFTASGSDTYNSLTASGNVVDAYSSAVSDTDAHIMLRGPWLRAHVHDNLYRWFGEHTGSSTDRPLIDIGADVRDAWVHHNDVRATGGIVDSGINTRLEDNLGLSGSAGGPHTHDGYVGGDGVPRIVYADSPPSAPDAGVIYLSRTGRFIDSKGTIL